MEAKDLDMERTAMLMELNGTTKKPAPLRERGERGESNRRLESIKRQRRQARREKWLQSVKPHANARAERA
jgi:hypothetical protein